VQKLVQNSGSAYHQHIEVVTVSVTSGVPMRKSSQKKRIAVSAKIADKLITSSVGIVLYAKKLLALFVKHFLSRKRSTCITLSLDGLSLNTIYKLWLRNVLRATTIFYTIDLLQKSCVLNIVNGSNEIEAQSKAFSAISITFTQDAKNLQFTNDMLDINALARNSSIFFFLLRRQRVVLGFLVRCFAVSV
jgi:hypothetical protein